MKSYCFVFKTVRQIFSFEVIIGSQEPWIPLVPWSTYHPRPSQQVPDPWGCFSDSSTHPAPCENVCCAPAKPDLLYCKFIMAGPSTRDVCCKDNGGLCSVPPAAFIPRVVGGIVARHRTQYFRPRSIFSRLQNSEPVIVYTKSRTPKN